MMLASLSSAVIELDHWLFHLVNHRWTNIFFDKLFPAITDMHKSPYFWLAMLPLLALWVWKKKRKALFWITTAALSVALSDIVAYRLIKRTVMRNRPPDAGIQVDLRTTRYAGTSFPSNHATNMFAAATALAGSMPLITATMFFAATMVAYSRVYVGVHFPLDVLAGALLGTLIAWLIRRYLRFRWFKSDADSSHERSLSP